MARNRGIDYTLTRDEFEKMTRSPCWYCGDMSGNTVKTKNFKEGFKYNGIDRKDPKKPYETSNCVACCGRCNMAKGSLSEKDFIDLARKITSHTTP